MFRLLPESPISCPTDRKKEPPQSNKRCPGVGRAIPKAGSLEREERKQRGYMVEKKRTKMNWGEAEHLRSRKRQYLYIWIYNDHRTHEQRKSGGLSTDLWPFSWWQVLPMGCRG